MPAAGCGVCSRAMSSVLRALTVLHCVVACPVLFAGQGGASGAEAGRSAEVRVVASSVTEKPEKVVKGKPAAVKHVDAAGAAKLLARTPEVVVIDVRTPEEYAEGHLKGAKNLDFNSPEFREQLAKLDRDRTYLVHCAVGGRSKRSLARFQELGFKSVVHMDGGYEGWVKAGKPVAR